MVPEFFADTAFSVNSERLFDEVKEAKAQGHSVKAVLLGPVSFLYLGREKVDGFDRLSLLPKLLPVYRQILSRLHEEGVEWVQMDEPVLGLDIDDKWLSAFDGTYAELSKEPVKLLLTTYFSSLAGTSTPSANYRSPVCMSTPSEVWKISGKWPPSGQLIKCFPSV